MEINLQNLGKRFNREQIFTGLDYKFKSPNHYALTGPNGSGKSTLLQVIAGNQLASSGSLTYSNSNAEIPAEDFYQQISFASPYLEIIEEFTLIEQLNFHFKFKPLRNGETLDSILGISYLAEHKFKIIKHFSSGMKQRLKLALAFFSDTPILLLDEPTTNMDEKGIVWYQDRCAELGNRMLIVASNQKYEYSFCSDMIDLSAYKSKMASY